MHVAPGVGLAPVNALSEVLEVEVRRNGYVWRQRYARGKPVSALERGQRTERTGTTLRFQVDRAIFGALAFDRGAIQERLEELAIWNPKLEIELMARTIREPRGTVAWLDRLASQTDAEPPPDPCVTRALRDGVLVDVAFGWARTSRSEVRSFVGQHETEEGGSHEGGFWAGVVTALVAHRSGAFRGVRPSRLRDRLAPGLFAVVHVCLPDPRYAGSIRACLASDVARRAVRAEVHEAFGVHLSERPALVRRLLARLDG